MDTLPWLTPGSSCGSNAFHVGRVRTDRPVASYEMVAEIVDINDHIHANTKLDQRLCGRREVHQQYLFFPRRAPRFR